MPGYIVCANVQRSKNVKAAPALPSLAALRHRRHCGSSNNSGRLPFQHGMAAMATICHYHVLSNRVHPSRVLVSIISFPS